MNIAVYYFSGVSTLISVIDYEKCLLLLLGLSNPFLKDIISRPYVG
ncbi:hypothetical protein HMPREF1261_00843 [Corynebacterium sp. KPL1818]|nr:hypothetical protein HMPREF1267_00469 [Corynebacterium sp. KPL1824]ERS61167.1 hypothetical protein HMPREF1261_00843 [Corynebacterium sp. KPL1818]UQZ27136.1 hypothetical protein CACC_02040 [Corynebacterium accolens]